MTLCLRQIVCVAAAVVCGAAFQAPAAQFTSERGFSLTYPDGWKVTPAPRAQPPDGGSATQPAGAAATSQPAGGKATSQPAGTAAASQPAAGSPAADGDGVAVTIFNPAPGAGCQNVNVAVLSAILPMTAKGAADAKETVEQEFASLGMEVSGVESRLIKASGRDAIESRWTITAPKRKESLRQLQVILAGKKHTFLITCSAGAADFDRAEPVFRQIIDSFQIDPKVDAFSSRTDWLNSLPPLVRSVVIGAIVGLSAGGVVALLRGMRRRRARTMRSDE